MTPRARQVAELLDRGYSVPRVAQELGTSAPNIHQIIARNPELLMRRHGSAAFRRLQDHRGDLDRLRLMAQELLRDIRRELRVLDEELEAAEIDRLVGLRPTG